jgi:hypothetical protein
MVLRPFSLKIGHACVRVSHFFARTNIPAETVFAECFKNTGYIPGSFSVGIQVVYAQEQASASRTGSVPVQIKIEQVTPVQKAGGRGSHSQNALRTYALHKGLIQGDKVATQIFRTVFFQTL